MGFELRKLDEIEPSTGAFELLPDGDYRLGVVEISDLLATNDGLGGYVKFKFEVVDGDRAGTPIWNNFNIEHQKADVSDRAWKDLSALGHAVGVFGGSSDALMHKTFMAKVGTQKGKANPKGGMYPDSNNIRTYHPQGATPPAAPPSAVRPVASQATPAPVAGVKKAPWAK